MKRTGRTLRTGGSLALFVLVTLAHADAQPVVLPPLWTESHWVQHLTSSPVIRGKQLDASLYLLARTNVRPLLQSSGAEQLFAGGYGYYRFASLSDLQLRLSLWRLSYAFGVADYFEGDQGAVHLYLGDGNLAQLPATDIDVSATLNRSAVNRWTVEHLVPLHSKHGESWLVIAGSLYVARRIQQGVLNGKWQNAQFDGNLLLDTTRGLSPDDTRSVGLGMHLALSVPLSARWRVGFWGENLLGRVWQCKVQRITARVQARTVIPDADGFLHAAPLLSGRIDYLSEDLSLQRRVTLGVAYQRGNSAWFLFASRDADGDFAAGYASARYWLLLSLPRREWQMACRAGQWELVMGLSALNPSQAKCATLRMRWAVPLGW